MSYPSLGYVGINEFDYHLTLVDAAGRPVAESAASPSAGTSQFFVDLTQGSYTFGTWAINIRGELGAQDQDTIMGVRVSLAVSQLAPQTRVSPTLPEFVPEEPVTYYFQCGPAGLLTSPEGCDLQAGAPVRGLATAKGTGPCQSGSMGYAVNYGAGVPAEFTSTALAAPLTVGGTLSVRFYLTDPAQPVWQSTSNPRLGVEVDAIDVNGDLLLAVAFGEWALCSTSGGTTVCNAGPQPVAGTYTMQIPALTLPAVSRISVLVRETSAVTSSGRTVYGGQGLTASFADAGITFTTGTLQ